MDMVGVSPIFSLPLLVGSNSSCNFLFTYPSSVYFKSDFEQNIYMTRITAKTEHKWRDMKYFTSEHNNFTNIARGSNHT